MPNENPPNQGELVGQLTDTPDDVHVHLESPIKLNGPITINAVDFIKAIQRSSHSLSSLLRTAMLEQNGSGHLGAITPEDDIHIKPEYDVIDQAINRDNSLLSVNKSDKNDFSKNNNKKNELETRDTETERISTWITPELKAALNRALKHEKTSQQDWLKAVIAEKLGEDGYDNAPPRGVSSPRSIPDLREAVPTSKHKKSVGFTVEPMLADAVHDAAKEAGLGKNKWFTAAIVHAIVNGLDVQECLDTLNGKTEGPDIAP